MTRTEIMLLVGAAGAAIAAVIYWQRSAPRRVASSGVAVSSSILSGGGALASLAGLPDASTLPLGTVSADGRWVVRQSRQADSVPHWESTGALGGGIPGMIT